MAHTRYALCIGLNEYENLPEGVAKPDEAGTSARLVRDRLLESGFKSVKLLDERATTDLSSVHQALEEWLEGPVLAQDDVLLVYWAGCVVRDGGGKLYLMTSDSQWLSPISPRLRTFIGLDYLAGLVQNCAVPGVKVLLGLDGLEIGLAATDTSLSLPLLNNLGILGVLHPQTDSSHSLAESLRTARPDSAWLRLGELQATLQEHLPPTARLITGGRLDPEIELLQLPEPPPTTAFSPSPSQRLSPGPRQRKLEKSLNDALELQAELESRQMVSVGNPTEFRRLQLELDKLGQKIGGWEAELERLERNASVDTSAASERTGAGRVFISYKHEFKPDEDLALEIYRTLEASYEVFIDRLIPPGTNWVERIEQELSQADFLITLLSANSVASEMVIGEIAKAHRLARSNEGRPQVLPVRVAYREPFEYPLSEYLKNTQWAEWHGPQDTPRLCKQIRQALAGEDLTLSGPLSQATHDAEAISFAPTVLTPLSGAVLPVPTPSAQPLSLEKPEGTMNAESSFYIVRTEDEKGRQTVGRIGHGETITIKGPRQMGKSSLLIRLVRTARQAGKRVAFLDFQLFDKAALADPEIFYRQFCAWLSDKLDLEDRIEDPKLWRTSLGHSQRCTRYLERYVLKEISGPLVLAMDEVETMFDTAFRSDFFGMLRGWHNSRADEPLWAGFDQVLVTSTEPYQLIDNLNQSPFNVGEVLELTDFSPAQVAELNRRHAQPLAPVAEQRLVELLGGHPFLTRRALFAVASGRVTPQQLFDTASDDRGTFGDHLRNHLFRLHGRAELVEGLRGIFRNVNPDEHVFWKLRGAGLVRREGRTVVMRCQLYDRYFREHL